MRRAGPIILALALGILPAPLTVDAQQRANVHRIGILSSGGPPPPAATAPFVQDLRALGYIEGQNITIERRYAEGRIDRLPDLVTELLRLRVELIVTIFWPAAQAAHQATTTLPIVAMAAGDLVGTGLVASLAHPGGNLTGVTVTELSAKRLELLKETVPKLSRAAVLWNRADAAMSLMSSEVQGAGRALGVTLRPLGVREPNDFDRAFAAMTQERPDALLMIADPFTFLHRDRVLRFAAQHRLPAMYTVRGDVEAGGLMSYGPSYADMSRRIVNYVDRILKATKPSDLPVEQPTRFELLLNLKTAKALGLTFPPSILVRADQVIQ